MIIFLYGQDGYRLFKAREGIISEYKKKYSSGVNLFYVDLSSDSYSKQLSDILKSASFFNEHKLAVLSGAFSRKTTADSLCEIADDLSSAKDMTFFFCESLPEKDLASKGKNLLKKLSSEKNTVKTFDFLEDAKLTGWVQEEFRTRNCSIGSVALRTLINSVGNDSWALINEIEKLAAFKRAGEIAPTDIELLSSHDPETNVFGFLDMLSAGRAKEATVLLYKEIKSGADPYQLLGAVAYQFRNTLIINDLAGRGMSSQDIAKKAGLHPFVVKKTLANIGKFKDKEMKSAYKKLLDIDIRSKMGLANIGDSLFELISEVK